MNIKNYTSEVPADRSITEIERVLITLGARNIMKEYDGFGKVSSIAFSIPKEDVIVPIKLPAKTEAIKNLFLKEYKTAPSKDAIEKTTKQAERTAWKNIHEWVQLQATMIKLEQVEFMEVFMPYIYSLEKGKTAYQLMQEKGYQKLLS
jgi:hypothetical protein